MTVGERVRLKARRASGPDRPPAGVSAAAVDGSTALAVPADHPAPLDCRAAEDAPGPDTEGAGTLVTASGAERHVLGCDIDWAGPVAPAPGERGRHPGRLRHRLCARAQVRPPHTAPPGLREGGAGGTDRRRRSADRERFDGTAAGSTHGR
jgi:hypothetical protein